MPIYVKTLVKIVINPNYNYQNNSKKKNWHTEVIDILMRLVFLMW